jgi:hypothetical protein
MFVCDYCGKIFGKRSEVARHLKGVHNRKLKDTPRAS